MMAPLLSFIVATRNRSGSLVGCLESIEAQHYPYREILVVDDCSTDDTESVVRSRFPTARYLRTPEQLGSGRALGMGAAQATGNVFVHIDDDALFASPGAAERIVAQFERHPDFGVLCFRCEAPDGSIRRREIPRRDKRLPRTETEIGCFLGGAVAFRASAIAAGGGYPADIGWGSWENDVAYRLFKAGVRTLFTPDIRVIHYAIPSPQNTTCREANYVRNEIVLAARYLPAPYAQVHASLWIVLSTVQAIARQHLRDTLQAIRVALKSWRALRADPSDRLTADQARRLGRLSGRTWY